MGCVVRESEPKAGAQGRSGLRPDRSAVTLEYAFDDGEADAVPGQVRRHVEALEDAEKPAVIGHVESHPVV